MEVNENKKAIRTIIAEEPDEDLEVTKTTVGSTSDERPHRQRQLSYKKGTLFANSIRTASERERVKNENINHVIFPWSKAYITWWSWTVFCSIFTALFETYEIGFVPAGLKPVNKASNVLEYFLLGIFVLDIFVHFNLAVYDEADQIVCDRKEIAKKYAQGMFRVDLVGVLPFDGIALAIAGQIGKDTRLSQCLALLRLAKLVRLHRVVYLFQRLQYNGKVSLTWLTMCRNFSAALLWTHFAACIFFFIARLYRLDADTWIGGSVAGMTPFERYVTSLYLSIVTFATVGYGDLHPVNAAEEIFCIVYMMVNIIFQSWIIGSITLLVVKGDAKTSDYRDTLESLEHYAHINDFEHDFKKRLKTQLKLEFNNREVADEQVLKHFPSTVRRRVLRELYLPYLSRTNLMRGIRQQFVDAFLSACNVEIFSPNEQILTRGSVSSDLYLLVAGVVNVYDIMGSTEDVSGYGSISGSMDGSRHGGPGSTLKQLKPGEFINEVGFFTESPQIETVRTVTICKTLTMSRSAYKLITEDHPGSVGKILQNLLAKVKGIAEVTGTSPSTSLPKRLEMLRAGSAFFDDSSRAVEVRRAQAAAQAQKDLTAVQDLVEMHLNKIKDDQTTRFLFAASRGDSPSISLMCNRGLDPNSADYDNRTALMVAAMNGNSDTVQKLLEFGANPNILDMHGSSALFEAVKNGHDGTIEILLKHNAKLCMTESLAASTLCQAVFDGDILMLKRLLKANIDANAGDYDKRTAIHIAAAEGSVAAVRVLVAYGADLGVRDRWNNTIHDEARRAKAGHVLAYLESLEDAQAAGQVLETIESHETV